MAPAPRFSIAEQEKMIIESSAKVIEASSLLDFKMSAIAKEAGISMGSVYKHVQSKEDVLMALATEIFAHMSQTFSVILSLPLTTPEHCVAINLLDFEKVSLFSFDADLDRLVTNDAVLKRCSPSWKNRMLTESKKIDDECFQLLQEAADSGELNCPENKTEYLERLNLGWWAFSVGFNQASQHKNELNRLFGEKALDIPFQPQGYQVQNFKAFLNTFDWKTPLSDEGILKTCELLKEKNYR